MSNTAQDHTWFFVGQLVEEGPRTAVYPYSKLRPIREPSDVRSAIIDETQPLESEFGVSVVEPLYRLVWLLNTGRGVFTSHTLIAPPEAKAPYNWARHYVAAQIIVLSRDSSERMNLPKTVNMMDELRLLIAGNPTSANNTRGWFLQLSALNVMFERARGYGGGVIVGGCASSRQEAARRWCRACLFLESTLTANQTADDRHPAPPHHHTLDTGEPMFPITDTLDT